MDEWTSLFKQTSGSGRIFSYTLKEMTIERNDQMRLGQSANIEALKYSVSLTEVWNWNWKLASFLADIGVVLTQHRVGDKITRSLNSRGGKRCFCIPSTRKLQDHSLQLTPYSIIISSSKQNYDKFSKKQFEGESFRI